ncbi:MAG: hypothetical protein ACYCZU_13780 [Devosia sp.]
MDRPRRVARDPGRVVAWLKYLENGSATAARGMEGYDFTWMWKELGLLDRRK